MPYPDPYQRSYDFTTFQEQFPAQPLPAAQIDANFDNVGTSINQTQNRAAIIQRDDGQLKNKIVTVDSLSNSVAALLGSSIVPRGAWVTATVYAAMDLVSSGGVTYLAVSAHTATGSFATDLAGGLWILFSNALADSGTSYFQKFAGNGSQTVFTTSSDLGEDENSLMVFYDNGTTDYQPVDPADYTISGTTLTFGAAPLIGTNNIYVFAPSLLLGAASSSAAAAAVSAAAALASELAAAASSALTTGTSTTSLAIAVAEKIFTTQESKTFLAGKWLLITSDADPTNYMHGQVTSYSGTTLTVDVTNIGGSGTLADWTITLAGTQGSIGATGPSVDLVDEATPQLGGNLDVNGNSIVSVSAGNISITPDGAGVVIIDGLSHPIADGTVGQVLATDGAGLLDFVDIVPQGFTDVQKFTASGTWTKPAGATKFLVICTGGGGPGGTSTSSTRTAGGGGSAATSISFFASGVGATETVTIAAPGGSTTFGSLVAAAGGNTGSNDLATISGGGADGAPTTFNLLGLNGGTGGDGGGASTSPRGYGAPSYWGGGNDSSGATTNHCYGAGGRGGRNTAGGAGGTGVCVIYSYL